MTGLATFGNIVFDPIDDLSLIFLPHYFHLFILIRNYPLPILTMRLLNELLFRQRL